MNDDLMMLVQSGNEGGNSESGGSGDGSGDGSGESSGGGDSGSSGGGGDGGGTDLQPADISMDSIVPMVTDKLMGMFEGLVKMLPLLAIALVVLVLTWIIAWIASKLVSKTVHSDASERSLGQLAGTLTKTVVWILGILTAMSIVFPSVNPAAILSGLGVGGVVIGIAFQDTFQNFMAGVLIMLRRSMKTGDYLDTDSVQGRIEEINLRDTYLRRVDGELVIVPNNHLFKNPVRVWTDPDFRRYEIVVGVGYDEDVAKSRDVIQRALDSLDLGGSDKKPQVFAKEFGASSVNYTVRWWADPEPLGFHESRGKVVTAIKEALDDAGIEIPYPYRTLTFKEPLKLGQGDGGSAGSDGQESGGRDQSEGGAHDSRSSGDRPTDEDGNLGSRGSIEHGVDP